MNVLCKYSLAYLKHILADKRGNVALMTALMLVPVLAVSGAAVDIARVTAARAQLNAALESAVLASASLNNTVDPETVITEFIRKNVAVSGFSENVNIDILENTSALNSRLMTVQATADVPTFFLKLMDVDKIGIVASSKATQASTNVEIALVLDISSSMNGNRLTNLKDAAPTFVNAMFDDDADEYTSINLIPFGGTVNIGPSFFADYTRSDPDSSDDTDGVLTNPSKSLYNLGVDLIDDGILFTDSGDCIEYHKDDFDMDLIPENSRAQVPHFWKWNNFNPWCPEEESAMLLNSNDPDALNARIAEMTLSDGTGMDIGTLWAAKTLSPLWRGKLGGDFDERPLDYDDTTMKIAILMTDGGITNQVRPENYTYFSTHEYAWPHTKNRGKINKSQGRDKNQQQIVKKGGQNDDLDDDSAVGYFNHLCDLMKQNGVIVYTIGFQIKEGSAQDKYLEKCASTPGNYYFVESLDIEAAFNSIAASISALRIIG